MDTLWRQSCCDTLSTEIRLTTFRTSTSRRTSRILARAASLLDAVDPDLSKFYDRGGKLILAHGWADYAITAEGTINYYAEVKETLGEEKTDDFLRLYVMPGVYHCNPGEGPSQVDWLGVLEKWVAEDDRPEEVIATGGPSKSQSRPLCPYPEIALYDSEGDSRFANAFSCGTPDSERTPGDTNRDGRFNSTDLVLAFQGGLFEKDAPATWIQGDWNFDGRFDTGDLVKAFSKPAITSRPRWLVCFQASPESRQGRTAISNAVDLALAAQDDGVATLKLFIP